MHKIYYIIISFFLTCILWSCKPDFNNKWDPYEFPRNISLSQGENEITDKGSYDSNFIRLLENKTQQFTINNSGAENLIIYSITLQNNDEGLFVLDTSGMSLIVPPRSNTSFIISFTPTSVGRKSCDVQIQSDDPDCPLFSFTYTGDCFDAWGTLLCDEENIYHPLGITVDGSGDVYVADKYNRRIQKFDPNGNFIKSWGSYGIYDPEINEIKFERPNGVAVDSSGYIYAVDGRNENIIKFDSDGNNISCFQEPESIYYSDHYGIAVNGSGHIFISNGDCSTYINGPVLYYLFEFDASGNLLAQWGTEGSGEGEFQCVKGIALDNSGNLYAVDYFNERIQKFNSNHVYLGWLGHDGTDAGWHAPGSGESSAGGSVDGAIYFPYGVAIDDSDNVYVADTGNDRIQKFDSAGNYSWKEDGGVEGPLTPYGIAVYSTDSVYVTDPENHRIWKFNQDGVYQNKWEPDTTSDGKFNKPKGIVIDSSENVYIADANNHRIQKFTADGVFTSKWGTNGTANGQFDFPTGIAIDNSNNVYVADTNNHRIQKFTSSGTYTSQWGTWGSNDGEFRYPKGIDIDSTGNIYVVDTGNNRIQSFNSSGGFISKWGVNVSGDQDNSEPIDIAIDGEDSIYVIDAGNECIKKFTSDGTFIEKWDESNFSYEFNFEKISGITIDNSGNIYVFKKLHYAFDGYINVFDSNMNLLKTWRSESFGGVLSMQYETEKYFSGIAISPSNYIYISDYHTYSVLRFQVVLPN